MKELTEENNDSDEDMLDNTSREDGSVSPLNRILSVSAGSGSMFAFPRAGSAERAPSMTHAQKQEVQIVNQLQSKISLASQNV